MHSGAAANIPWDRYALITELANRAIDVSPQLGKTALQKLLYLLDGVYGINVGYDFGLHTYGPFDSKVLNDLDFVDAMGGIKIKTEHDPKSMGFFIEPGPESERIREKAPRFLADSQIALDDLIQKFGHKTARELELLATIVYIDRHVEENNYLTRDDFLVIVHGLKLKFDRNYIDSKLSELEQFGFISRFKSS